MIRKILDYKIESLIFAIGVLFGTSCYFFPHKYVFLVAVGIIGCILVLWKVEIGIFTSILLLPFLPTILIVGLTLITVFSFFIRIMLTDIKLKYGPLSIWITLFGSLILLYSVFSVTPKSSLPVAFIFISYIVLFFVIINTVTSKKAMYLLIFTLLCSSTIESLYGIYQYKIGIATGFNNWTDPELFPEMKTRIFGTLDNPNILAQYLEFIMPLSIGLFWIEKNILKKFMFLGMSGVMLLCLLLTGSRGGWLAFVISMIVFGILKDRRILLLGFAFGLVSINFLPDSIITRIASIANFSESSNSYRIFLWGASFEIVKDFWMSGVGIGVDAFQKIYTSFYIREGVFAFHTHNLYLQILIESGIFGFITFLGIIFMSFRHGLITLINSTDELTKTVLAALIAGLTGFLFHGITENSFYNFKILYLFWFMLGLIMTIREMNIDIKQSPTKMIPN